MSEFKTYISIMRLNRWALNLFMIAGFLFAIVLSDRNDQLWNPMIIVALLSLATAAFTNYTINEYLDAEFDAAHPEKKNRPGAKGLLKLKFVLLEYFLLMAIALILAWLVNIHFFILIIVFLLMGVIYNVRPFRTKDKPYLDVLSESVNNPVRFLCGWFVLPGIYFPPITMIVFFWMTGAFLMAIKRYAEYRYINDPKLVAFYRKSFIYYSENKLLSMAFFLATVGASCLAAFLLLYSEPSLALVPLYALFVSWYANIGMKKNSKAQHPEHLYRSHPMFIGYVLFFIAAAIVMLSI